MFITHFSPDYHIGNQLRPTDSDEFKRLIQIFFVGGKWFQNNTYEALIANSK